MYQLPEYIGRDNRDSKYNYHFRDSNWSNEVHRVLVNGRLARLRELEHIEDLFAYTLEIQRQLRAEREKVENVLMDFDQAIEDGQDGFYIPPAGYTKFGDKIEKPKEDRVYTPDEVIAAVDMEPTA